MRYFFISVFSEEKKKTQPCFPKEKKSVLFSSKIGDFRQKTKPYFSKTVDGHLFYQNFWFCTEKAKIYCWLFCMKSQILEKKMTSNSFGKKVCLWFCLKSFNLGENNAEFFLLRKIRLCFFSSEKAEIKKYRKFYSLTPFFSISC